MATDFLLKPILTEKALLDQERGAYHFFVWPRSNRHQIKLAVESFFGVKVAGVNTLNIKGKVKSNRRAKGAKFRRPNRKKAIVLLAPGEEIKQLSVGKEKKHG